MDSVMKGWFSEVNDMWKGMCLSLKITEVIHKERSKYQEIMVLQTLSQGKVLTLDGIIQCSEFDEFAYQEMISYLPLCCHPNPQTVLIVGGGDGGVAREVDKLSSVTKIDMVEIDERVVKVSKQYLPNMAVGFESKKLKLHIKDGIEFVKQNKNTYDVIITDSSDPVGPAVCLFEKEYYILLKEALKPGGIICSQAGSIWCSLDTSVGTYNICKEVFDNVAFACVNVPTYPTGQIGLLLASTDSTTDFKRPVITFNDTELEQKDFKYYNSEVHSAALVLPNQFQKHFR